MVTKRCTYMLTNTTADEGKKNDPPVSLMIMKNYDKKTDLFHEEEWKSWKSLVEL